MRKLYDFICNTCSHRFEAYWGSSMWADKKESKKGISCPDCSSVNTSILPSAAFYTIRGVNDASVSPKYRGRKIPNVLKK